MKVLFCGGGTAGHVYPNIAIAETLAKNVSNVKFAYVTTENGIENSLIDFEKIPIHAVGIKKSRPITSSFEFVISMIKSIKEARKIIRKICPDVIIGTGGYATFPVAYAGHKEGVKIILHESNAIPGKAIKALERKADLILVNYEESRSCFVTGANVKRVGNPIRSGYYALSKNDVKEKEGLSSKKVVLSFGGSLGAPRINDSIVEFIENYLRFDKDTYLFFVTGKRDYSRIKKMLKDKGLINLKNLSILDYAYDMPRLVALADVVISRAGAMTISELSLSGKCSILIPSPNVANNHQVKNAKVIAEKNGAVMITEDKLYSLTDTVRQLLNNSEERKTYEENIKKFSLREANKKICYEILNILEK